MNYSALVEQIQSICQTNETTFNANIERFIQTSERKIHMAAKLPSSRKNASGVTVLGTRALTLPSDYINVKALEITTAGGPVNLLPKAPEFLNEMYPVQTTLAQPKFWAYSDETTINLAPTPDQAYPVMFHYFAMPASIVTQGTTWLSNNYEQVLLYGSVVEAYIFLKGAPEVMAYYTQAYESALGELKGVASESRMQNYR
jgi:hypothetical protein